MDASSMCFSFYSFCLIFGPGEVSRQFGNYDRHVPAYAAASGSTGKEKYDLHRKLGHYSRKLRKTQGARAAKDTTSKAKHQSEQSMGDQLLPWPSALQRTQELRIDHTTHTAYTPTHLHAPIHTYSCKTLRRKFQKLFSVGSYVTWSVW